MTKYTTIYDLEHEDIDMGKRHGLDVIYINPNLYQNTSINDKIMDQIRPSMHFYEKYFKSMCDLEL